MHPRQYSGAYIRLAFLLSPCANAQFTYPPPLVRPLTDYTSGKIKSALNFSAGDSMFGGWSTPGDLASFLLYRCTHTPSSETIYPSNSSFDSDSGEVAADGTWEQMPLYDYLDNGFNSGDNPIWVHGEFLAPNDTTGSLCWFELYPGYDEISYRAGRSRARLEGSGPWYFATVPFTVNPKRSNNLTVTWKNDGTDRGEPTRDIFDENFDVDTFLQEFPSASSSKSKSSGSKNSGPTVHSERSATFAIVLFLLFSIM